MCSIFIMCTGCASMVDLTMNILGGALGNMLDRRVEDKLGNDANLSDEKLDGKLSKKKNEEEFTIEVDSNIIRGDKE